VTNGSSPAITWGVALRTLVKAAALFALANLLFALAEPLPALGRVSIYNALVPGRERLPYGESAAAYNLSLDSVEAMFAAHAVSAPKRPDEFRLFLIGDSSTWGILLTPAETLAGQINAAGLVRDGRTVRAYNLGHPILSAAKDLMLLDYAMQFQPDAVIWLVTLESLARAEQLDAPLLRRNASRVRDLLARYALDYALDLPAPTFWERTLIGQRRALADWWRLQAFGVMWASTGIDQVIGAYTPRSNDLDADESWMSIDAPRPLTDADLALDVLAAGFAAVGDVPLTLVNEPIFVADGAHSDVRYNAWYPRWAYDAYRDLLAQRAESAGWRYLDLWDAVPPPMFTDSPVHRNADGERLVLEVITNSVMSSVMLRHANELQ
jgi:hypothetical protein